MKQSTTPIQLLPFQFQQINTSEVLAVNECGDYLFIDNDSFETLTLRNEINTRELFGELKSKHFICTRNLADNIEMIATKYRSRKRFISDFTALHMMVLTLRCTNNCSYCQVSAEGEEAKNYDMSPETARRIVDLIFESPAPRIKIEFQGGEPTLNWLTLKETVEYASKIKKKKKKIVDFVICTNLVKVTDKQLRFYKKHNIHISTSLDGPKHIHDQHRVLKNNKGTYEVFVNNLSATRNHLGDQAVSALMTTTKDSIEHLIEIIDEYINRNFNGIFIRSLNPYGFASEKMEALGYDAQEFVKKYSEALDYIIEYNIRTGKMFVEYFSALLLARILTPFSTGFVDLQSPSGAGISGVIYDHNGNVFPADEARMLSRMGDDKFLMGNAKVNTYNEIFGSLIIREITSKSCVEVMPYCANCVFQAYCGADPIRNYLTTGDLIGRRPDNGFCTKNKLIFELLFLKIKENNPETMDVFWSWISRKSLADIKR